MTKAGGRIRQEDTSFPGETHVVFMGSCPPRQEWG